MNDLTKDELSVWGGGDSNNNSGGNVIILLLLARLFLRLVSSLS